MSTRRQCSGFSVICVLLAAVFACSPESPSGDGEQVVEMEVLRTGEIAPALELALKNPFVFERSEELLAVLRAVPDGGWGEAADFISRHVSRIDDEDVRLYIAARAQADPRAAMEEVFEWGLESKRRYGARVAARAWAAKGNVVEASKYVQEIAEAGPQMTALLGLSNGWGLSGQTIELAEFLVPFSRSFRDGMIEEAVVGINRAHGLEEIIAWHESIPEDLDEEFKSDVFFKALRQVSAFDAESGANWFGQYADQDWAFRGHAVVASEWVEQDPESALEWMLSVPSEKARQYATMRLVSRWIRVDPTGAFEWFESMQDKDSELAIRKAFLAEAVRANPIRASQWLERVSEGARDEFILAIAEPWTKYDLAAASAWLDEIEMSEALARKVSRSAPRWSARRDQLEEDPEGGDGS